MPQARRKKPDAVPLTLHVTRGLREGFFFLLAALAVYLTIALVTYSINDPGWSQDGPTGEVVNLGGIFGAYFADGFLYLFGYPAFLFPVMVAYSGWLVFHGRTPVTGIDAHLLALRWLGFVITLAAACGLAQIHYDIPPDVLPVNAGGVLGDVVYRGLVSAFSFLGATLFLLALFLAGVTLFTGLSWVALMDHTGQLVLKAVRYLRTVCRETWEDSRARRERQEREAVVEVERQLKEQRRPVRIEPLLRETRLSARVEKEKQVPLFEPPADTELPPLSLLDEPPSHEEGYSDEALEAMSRLVEMKLKDFGVEAEVVSVHPGPVVTRFELKPGPGVKVNQISNLAKDLARALSTLSVRVVEVIPGKPYVGLEIPNEYRELVTLSEVLRSDDYDQAASPLTLALGKDIGGHPVVADLARMPHLLVAGTTGSGKSVAINGMVLSLLYKTLPTDVRLIMVDPKMLELSVYEGIPHLLTPVVTDMNEAATALRWCVGEMERRYRLMAALGVRNIAGYNRKVRQAEEKGEPLTDPLFKPEEAGGDESPPELQPLPFIVVIVDELADMMMVVGKKIEQLIARLAQKARAAGIHLILATQRPSVDVITGLIKANIPTRIAFQVSSRVDSRTILDQMGAEQLLGHGDMLYLPPGTGMPARVHGAFVSDQEVHKVVSHLRGTSEPVYLEEVLQSVDEGGVAGNGDFLTDADTEADPLYDQAVAIVTRTRRASISGVQRRLKIGYNRAARMIEQMEATGVVGPLQSNGSREVLAPPPAEH